MSDEKTVDIRAADSSLSVREEPWNTPSVMAITPPLLTHTDKNALPPGSKEWKKIMEELYTEMETERRIKQIVNSEFSDERQPFISTVKCNSLKPVAADVYTGAKRKPNTNLHVKNGTTVVTF